MRFLWERFISVTELSELHVIPWKVQTERLGFHDSKKRLEFENEDFMFSRIWSSFDLARVGRSEKNEKRRRRRREKSLVEVSSNMFWKVQFERELLLFGSLKFDDRVVIYLKEDKVAMMTWRQNDVVWWCCFFIFLL